MIPVSDEPLRKRAAGEYSRAIEKLEKARGELRCFEQKERPAFQAWLAATFGALLTEIRENERQILEKQNIIIEVETEMMLSNHRNPRRAYAAVMKRREAGEFDAMPDSGPEDRGGSSDEDDWDNDEDFEEMGEEVLKEDLRAMFEEVLWSQGIDPRRLSKREFASMFADFEEEILGDPRQADRSEVREEKQSAAKPEDSRIKEINRILVRRLHPDLRADGDATVSAIWHDVQEAYEVRNLDRLETLLALTEMADGAGAGRASLAQMRDAVAELKRALRAVQRGLTEAKRDPAWGFSRHPYRGALEKEIRRDINRNLIEQREVLESIKCTLDDWSRRGYAPAAQPGRKSAGRGKSRNPAAVQTELFNF
jgi:hypothetical protein